MGFQISISPDLPSGLWTIRLCLNLSRQESNEIFLRGDLMLVWPGEGLNQSLGLSPGGLARNGMHISEVASRCEGIEIRYLNRGLAERAASALRVQLSEAGLAAEV
jgi:hypothetical protein